MVDRKSKYSSTIGSFSDREVDIWHVFLQVSGKPVSLILHVWPEIANSNLFLILRNSFSYWMSAKDVCQVLVGCVVVQSVCRETVQRPWEEICSFTMFHITLTDLSLSVSRILSTLALEYFFMLHDAEIVYEEQSSSPSPLLLRMSYCQSEFCSSISIKAVKNPSYHSADSSDSRKHG